MRIPFLKRCFNSVHDNDPKLAAMNCWFICNKFSLVRFTKLFDGEIQMILRVKLALFSFLRKAKPLMYKKIKKG